jgi:hypothetical protein
VLLLVAAEVPTTRLLHRLVPVLAEQLAADDQESPAAERLRMRLVVHAGEVIPDPYGHTGQAINHACSAPGPGPARWPPRSPAYGRCRCAADATPYHAVPSRQPGLAGMPAASATTTWQPLAAPTTTLNQPTQPGRRPAHRRRPLRYDPNRRHQHLMKSRC